MKIELREIVRGHTVEIVRVNVDVASMKYSFLEAFVDGMILTRPMSGNAEFEFAKIKTAIEKNTEEKL